MHIVFLVHMFPVQGELSTGGAGNYVANMAKEFVSHGHRVSVVTEAQEVSFFQWQGINVYRIYATKGFRNNGRPMSTFSKLIKNIERSFYYNRTVAKLNKKYRVDMVQSVNTYGLAMLRLKSIPYIVRVSDYPALWSGANKEKFDFDLCLQTKRIDEEIQKIALIRADAIITPSNLMKKITDDKINSNAYMVESPVCAENNSTLEFREKNFSENSYWLTYGAMIYRKSILMLAKLIDALLDEYPEMKYVMVGKDREVYYENQFMMASQMFYRNITKNRDRFIFLGEIADRKRLFALIKNATLCILPTRVDNLPNTVLESMALGKIIISSNRTSVEQLITDGYNGFLTAIDNEEELVQKIRYVMNLSLEDKRAIEDRAKERVRNLTPEKVYLKMMEVYTETIKNFKKGKNEVK